MFSGLLDEENREQGGIYDPHYENDSHGVGPRYVLCECECSCSKR